MKLRLLIYSRRYLFIFVHVSVNYVISISLMTANKEAWFDGDYYNITVLYITKMEMK
jgi:hypothetical protein